LFIRDTPSTAPSTHSPGRKPQQQAPPLPWTPAPYPFYDQYSGNPYMHSGGWDWWTGSPTGDMHFPGLSPGTMEAMRAASLAADMYNGGMMDMPSVDPMPLHSPSGKKERKRGQKGKTGPSQLSNPSRPRLQELRNLPQRGLGLRWVSDDRKFQVVKLQQTTASASPGPAATVVRPDPDGVLEATGGSKLPNLADIKSSVVCWAVDNWVARRFEASPQTPEWTETECVPLDNNEAGTMEEWARRFSQREKQLLVGKGTRGYRRFLRMIPKQMRKPGDPQTPRVAEQCSKRAFDGRLKQWRILLHAFSPRESEDEGEDGEPVDVPVDTNLMEEIHKALVQESQARERDVHIPPTPPKPTALSSPKSVGKGGKLNASPGTPLSAKGSRKSPLSGGPPPLTPSRLSDGFHEHQSPLAVVPGFPFPGFGFDQNGAPSPLGSPDHINAMASIAPPNLELLLPEFQDLLSKMGQIPPENLSALLQDFPVAPATDGGQTLEASAQDLIPTGLLEGAQEESGQDTLDLDVTLDRAKVPQDLRPLFKEAFSNVNHAFTKNADEREVILANAARAVIGSMPPTEQAPLKVLDTLLAFLNELRASYAPKAAQSRA
jgi:hypothetical protein